MNKIIIFLSSLLMITSTIQACVTVDLQTGTYTVDKNGSISEKEETPKPFEDK